jgi:hypothetical protein
MSGLLKKLAFTAALTLAMLVGAIYLLAAMICPCGYIATFGG